MSRRTPVPDDIKEVALLIKYGQLFELQDCIQSGHRVRCPELEERAAYCLEQACHLGFYSIVQLLLNEVEWEIDEKNKALEIVLTSKRVDLVELLLAHGADSSSADFADVCGMVDVKLMERFVSAGCDPCKHNGFARALDETKARPLLRFFRSHSQYYPKLVEQASLALASVVEEQKTRWAAMLVWAGADPLMRVPDSLCGDWDLSEDDGRVPVEVACSTGNVELFKVLRIQPTAALMQELLSVAVLYCHPEMIEMLLKLAPDLVNNGDPPKCNAIEHFIGDCLCGRGSVNAQDQDDQSAKCLELLLEAGARWVPNPDHLSYDRRRFTRSQPRDAVRILRLLLYVPNAVSRKVMLDFCDTPGIRRMIYRGDQKLSNEMKVMWQEID